jgi:hypothetical protein
MSSSVHKSIERTLSSSSVIPGGVSSLNHNNKHGHHESHLDRKR